MHLGEIPIKPVTDSLIKLARKGELLSRKYVREKIRAVENREAASAAYLERVKDCLKRVVEYATGKKVKLGLEGRRGYEEVATVRVLPKNCDWVWEMLHRKTADEIQRSVEIWKERFGA